MLDRNTLCRIGENSAKRVQSQLHLFPPLTNMPEDQELFKSIRIHSIYDKQAIQEMIARKDAFFFYGPARRTLMHVPFLSFSIGFEHNEIANAVDSIGFFDSEQISHEIAAYAESVVKIHITETTTEYSAGGQTFKADSDENKKTIMENIPLLSIIVDITSMFQSIRKAHGGEEMKAMDEQNQDIVSVEGWDFEWSEKQKFVSEWRVSGGLNFLENLFEMENLSCQEAYRLELEKQKGGVQAVFEYLTSRMQEVVEQVEGSSQYLAFKKRKSGNGDASQPKKKRKCCSVS